MSDAFANALAHVLVHEGGYVDHPDDPGGATNFGITLATLQSWRGRSVTKADVRTLTRGEAAEIYKARYWDSCRCDELPGPVAFIVFDAAVNHGCPPAAGGGGRCVRWPDRPGDAFRRGISPSRSPCL